MTSSVGIPGRDASSSGASLRRMAAALCGRPKAAAATAAAALAAALVSLWVAAGPAALPPSLPGAGLAVRSPGLAVPPLADDRGEVRRGRCANCGFVVGIREVTPADFEFTVRLRDGSVRISKAASRGTWHIGDAVMLMGEAAVPGR